MIIEFVDYNKANEIIEAKFLTEWTEIKQSLEEMPLHLKESDQAGIQGTPIFDVVGTNEHIKKKLQDKQWQSSIPIPEEYAFMGTNVDYGKNGIIVEVQFSNYPFLLNNILRSELFFKSGMTLAGKKTACVIIITKGHMFPASNSTLYYEQGKNQLSALSSHNVFDVPIRLVGLKEKMGEAIPVFWTSYSDSRYSRTVTSRKELTCSISQGRSMRSRCALKVKGT